MEDTAAMLDVAIKTARESRAELESIKNDVMALADVVQPKISEFVGSMRANRMAAVNEVREMLTSLRDVRKFFLDSDYGVEVDRLERFVRLCKELRQLRDDGTLEAVCDVALKLAVKEP